MGRFEDARAQFETALKRAPRRSLSLAGLARAAQKMNDREVVAKACAELSSIYAGADESVSRPEPCAAGAVIGEAKPAR